MSLGQNLCSNYSSIHSAMNIKGVKQELPLGMNRRWSRSTSTNSATKVVKLEDLGHVPYVGPGVITSANAVYRYVLVKKPANHALLYINLCRCNPTSGRNYVI